MLKTSNLINRLNVIVALIAAGLVFWNVRHQQKMVRGLREQIKKELMMEQRPMVEQLVKEELRRFYGPEYAKRPASERGQDIFESQEIRDAFYGMVAEGIRKYDSERMPDNRAAYLSDDELRQYIAGTGIEPDTVVQGQFVKNPKSDSADQAASVKDGALTADDLNAESGGIDEDQPESIERTMQQKGSVLLAKGRRIFEPGFTYAHFSTNRINIQGVTILDVFTIGPVSTQKIQRDMLIQTFGFKYGLADNLQGEMRIPFRYEFDRISNSDQTAEETRSKGGLGDIDFSIARQIGWEEGWKPDLIASLGVKTNTGEPIYNNQIALGTGHWALRGSLVAAKSSDPAVIFGSLSYTHSFKRSFSNYGEVAPGDTIGYSLGTAIALSYKTAINFSFDHSLTQKMKRGGEEVVGSFVNAANFKTGLNWALNEKASVDLSAAMGLTADSPDFTIEVRVPIYF